MIVIIQSTFCRRYKHHLYSVCIWMVLMRLVSFRFAPYKQLFSVLKSEIQHWEIDVNMSALNAEPARLWMIVFYRSLCWSIFFFNSPVCHGRPSLISQMRQYIRRYQYFTHFYYFISFPLSFFLNLNPVSIYSL